MSLRNPRYVIAVHDLARTAEWYRNILGFSVHEMGDAGWRMLTRGECTIMAGECPDAAEPASLGDHAYFAYLEADMIDAYHDAVVGRGADIVKSLRDEPWGMREFGVRTVDGHRVMFGQVIVVPR